MIQDQVVATIDANYGRLQGCSGQDANHGHSHLVAFGGNRTSGSIEVAPALLAQPGSGWKGDFESETFITQPIAFDTYNQTIGETAQTLCSRGDTPGGNAHLVPAVLAHAFDARQSDVLQYGDKTGPLDTDGHTIGVMQPVGVFQDSEFGVQQYDSAGTLRAGRIPEHQMVMQPVTYDLFNVTAPVNRQNRQPGDPCHTLGRSNAEHAAVVQAMAVRTANTSANGHGISAELAHTLDQAQGQAVLAPTLTATNDPSRSPQSSEITAQVAAVVQATAVAALFIQDDTTPKVNEERAGCLRRDAGGEGACVMTPAMQVRRLTPRECERLQGFPDDYTAIPWRNKPASECPDGPRYKALGNSWAVPCVRWIGRRIAERIA